MRAAGEGTEAAGSPGAATEAAVVEVEAAEAAVAAAAVVGEVITAVEVSAVAKACDLAAEGRVADDYQVLLLGKQRVSEGEPNCEPWAEGLEARPDAEPYDRRPDGRRIPQADPPTLPNFS